jgi:hypothetical protein
MQGQRLTVEWLTQDETSLEQKHDTLCDLGNMTINWDTFVIQEASTNAPYGWKNNQPGEIILNNEKKSPKSILDPK